MTATSQTITVTGAKLDATTLVLDLSLADLWGMQLVGEWVNSSAGEWVEGSDAV